MRVGSLFAAKARRSEQYAVLHRSRQLIRCGQIMQAIEELQAFNRGHPSLAVERRLVQTRHEAFLRLPRGKALSTWPPECADLFLGQTGIVEIDGEEFSPAYLRSGIFHHGAVLVRSLVPPSAVDRLRSDIEHAHAEATAVIEGRLDPEKAAYYSPFSSSDKRVRVRPEDRATKRHNGNILAMESPRALFDWLEVIRSFGIEDCIAEVLGERPVLSVEKTSLRRTSPDADKGYHQDGAFLGDVRSVNIWLALSECGIDSPSLDLVGTRVNSIWPTGEEGAPFDWALSDDTVDRMREDTPIIRPQFDPGDAIFFDHLTVHRTGVSPGMTRTRYALESWFFAGSCFPMGAIPICV